MIQKMKKSKGFTLIEMLVVIAIIAVLVSIIIPVVGNSTAKARYATDAANLRSMLATVTIDYMDNSTIDAVPTSPTSKTYNTAPEFYVDKDGGVIACYPGDSEAKGLYDVAAFSTAAETGATPVPIATPDSTNYTKYPKEGGITPSPTTATDP